MSMRARLGANDRLTGGLKVWNSRWIFKGLHIACLVCRAQQQAEDANSPFAHLDDCALAIEDDQRPWIELRHLLADLPPVRA